MEIEKINDEQLDQVSGGTQIPYIVRPGDTLTKIAMRHHCTVEQLCRWNNIRNPQDLKAGQKLVIRF